ncbi:MAG: hypothetical protein J5639_08630 [Bacteroidales bacterium]|nr:hypothetical protein [Bacteroidales bacterium]
MSELFLYYEGTLDAFLKDAIQEKEKLMKIVLGNELSVVHEDSFIIGDNYLHVVDNYAIRHIINKHSNEKELLRGQETVQLNDLLRIPDILRTYNTVKLEQRNNKTMVIYEKVYDDHICHLVEEVREGRKELAVVTFYKTKKGKLTGADS